MSLQNGEHNSEEIGEIKSLHVARSIGEINLIGENAFSLPIGYMTQISFLKQASLHLKLQCCC